MWKVRQKLCTRSPNSSLADNQTVRAVQERQRLPAFDDPGSAREEFAQRLRIGKFVGLLFCNLQGTASQMGAVLGHIEPCSLFRSPCFDPFSFRRWRRGVCAAKTDDVTAWGDPTESCRHQNRSPTRRTTRAHGSPIVGRVRGSGSAAHWSWVKHFIA